MAIPHSPNPHVIVAGHVCLDVIPTFGATSDAEGALFVPGRLTNIGPVVTAAGGAVSNTGLALHRLGLPTRLIGKVGQDLFGRELLDAYRRHSDALTAGMVIDPGAATSYTIVLSPPGVDRMFLHCAGANDTFGADDVDVNTLAGARLFHFGYPPLMRRTYADGGAGLADLFRRVRIAGLTVSLDLAFPDPGSDAGRADWSAFLACVLPHVDVFLPSLDELCFMLGHPEALSSGALLSDLAAHVLALGAAVVVIKLGDQGLYVRTTPDAGRLASLGAAAPATWAGRELLAPCFRVDVAGTTGAGDSTIAGFLAALLRGTTLEAALTGAVAVGACAVEHADATSGVPSWDAVQTRIAAGWPRRPVTLPLEDWRPAGGNDLLVGPHDGVGFAG